MTTVYTLGHSTREADEFRALLQAYAIEVLVDVRHYPGSRRFPHFGSAALSSSLVQAGVEYVHEVDLGGRRRATEDSRNGFWRSASFRAFADYMASPPFDAALERLIDVAARRRTAIMCAEAVPWRCHRWLISDALVLRGVEVVHIIDARHSQPHALNPNAQSGPQGVPIYPAVGELF